EFCREHGLFAPPPALAEPFADQLLRNAGDGTAVAVGGVEEVDPLVVSGIHDLEGVGLRRGPAEIHGAEADAADTEAGTAQVGVLHWSPPISRTCGERRQGAAAK